MRMPKNWLLSGVLSCALVLGLCAGVCHGEAGRTAAAFLKIPVGARANGMAGAFTALGDDASGSYWNPAGLARLENRTVTLVHNSWIMDMNHEYASYAQPVGSWGTLSFSAIGLLSGSIERCRRPPCDGNEGSFEAVDGCVSVSLAVRVTGGLAVGISGKGLVSQIDEERDYAPCGDVGILWTPVPRAGLSVAAVVKNLGQDMKLRDAHSPLPSTGVAGVAWTLDRGRFGVTLAGDYEHPKYDSERFRAGGELRVGFLALRGGYRRILSEQPEDEALTGPTFGFGVRYSLMSIDASYAELGGSLGSNIFVGLSFGL